MLKIGSFVFFILSTFNLFASDSTSTIIRGKHIDYAKTILKVTAIDNYISHTIKIVGVDTVSSNGDFEIKLDIKQTRLISLDLGQYQAVLYVEPGKEYNVILPPFKPKTMGEILNPFFQPTQIFLGIKNISHSNINYLIADFDEKYNNLIEANYYRIFKNRNQHKIDSAIETFEQQYDTVSNRYFSVYRKYKYAWIKYSSYMRDYRYIIRDYFNNQPINYYNVAYMDLFNQIFTNFFSFYMNTKEGERLFSDIAYAKSPKYISETLENSMVITNDTLQEFVILKGIYDGYYSGDFPSVSLTITLDSIELLTKQNEHKLTSQQIKEKVFTLKLGYPAPDFDLRDSRGMFRKNTDFLANYVYLNFCSVESFSCQQDFELIKKLYDKHKQEFKIVSISIDGDFNKARKYFEEHEYKWILLSYKSQKEIIDRYGIKAYPTYYLIDPKGDLKFSPALSPGENFEWQFFKMLQIQKRGTKH